MFVSEYEVREDRYYSKEHDWGKVEGDLCRTGISDYAQKSLHEVVYTEIPDLGQKVKQMSPIGTVESVKAVADIYAPITGEVQEVNEKLKENPELINKNPYTDGWIVVIKPKNLEEELQKLLDYKQYAGYLEEILKE